MAYILIKIVKQLNKKYISLLFNNLDMVSQFKILKKILFILNFFDCFFIIFSLLSTNSYFMEIMASSPGMAYSFAIHFLFKQATTDDFYGKTNYNALTYIRFGYIWTALAVIIQFNIGLANLNSHLDNILLFIDMILIILNIPVISLLIYYFDNNMEERNIRQHVLKNLSENLSLEELHNLHIVYNK